MDPTRSAACTVVTQRTSSSSHRSHLLTGTTRCLCSPPTSPAGGPQGYAATKPGSTPLGLEEAHRELTISPAIFDEVAAELGRSLDHFNVPEKEKGEVLAAFAAHKGEVTEGYSQ